jgi:hypothetical protein
VQEDQLTPQAGFSSPEACRFADIVSLSAAGARGRARPAARLDAGGGLSLKASRGRGAGLDQFRYIVIATDKDCAP